MDAEKIAPAPLPDIAPEQIDEVGEFKFYKYYGTLFESISFLILLYHICSCISIHRLMQEKHREEKNLKS